MSQSQAPTTDLTDDEQAAFEHLADEFDDDPAIQQLCEVYLDGENREANS